MPPFWVQFMKRLVEVNINYIGDVKMKRLMGMVNVEGYGEVEIWKDDDNSIWWVKVGEAWLEVESEEDALDFIERL